MDSRIPESWHEVLKRVQAVAPTAHIGGGAVRDVVLGRTVKDIDIFVPASAVNWNTLDKVVGGRLTAVNAGPEYKGWNPDVKAVNDYAVDGIALPVSIIGLGNLHAIHDNLARFDLGLAQAAYDGVRVITAPAFMQDAGACTMTLTHCENRKAFERSMIRYERLRAKYGGYSLVIPEKFFEHAPWHKRALVADEVSF